MEAEKKHIHSAIDFIRKNDSVNAPDSIATEYFGNKITRREYWDYIDGYRRFFINLGIGIGEPVTVCMMNSPEYEFVFAALLENGSIASSVSKSFLNADLKRQTIQRKSKSLILSVEFLPELIKNHTFAQLGENKGEDHLQRIILTTTTDYMPEEKIRGNNNSDYESLIRLLPENIEIIRPCEMAKSAIKTSGVVLPKGDFFNSIATYSNTGGTTGAPKCAMHTHEAIVSLLKSHDKKVYADFNMKDHSRSLLVIPISHITSQFYALLLRRAWGATIIYNPFSFDPTVLRKTLIDEKIDDVTLPFGLYYAITRTPFQKGELNLITPCCGGEPTPYKPTVDVNECLHRSGSNSLVIGTGSTEFGSGFMASYGVDGRSNESGCFFPGADGILIDPNTYEEINEPGKRGILYANAPWQMQGYYNDEKATSEFFNLEKDGVVYGTNNDIVEIVGEHNGKPLYSMLGRVSDCVKTDNGITYFEGINITENGSVHGNFDNDKFLFDVRDALLNIDGVMEAQPVLIPRLPGEKEGYPVADITIRKDCSVKNVLKKIYDELYKNNGFIPAGIIVLTHFERSLSSDKREILSLKEQRNGYYFADKTGTFYLVNFKNDGTIEKHILCDCEEIQRIDPPAPKLVFSSKGD